MDEEAKEYEAQQAKRLKKNLLDDIFSRKKSMLVEEFVLTDLGDKDTLVNIHHSYRAIQFLEDEIQSIINSSTIARSMIK